MKGASICNLKLDGHDVLDKKTKVNFDTTTHPQKVFLIVFTLIFGEHYILDKKTKVEFGTAIYRSEGLLDCVHVDVWGPTKTALLRGHQYFISFIDNLYRHCWVYPMGDKELNSYICW